MSDSGTGGGWSIVNLGELSKPATVLIEKVSDAVGGIAKPWQIKRVARAEAEADKIRAETQLEITEIQHRALIRLVREEGQKQENIESITAKAIPLLSAEAKPEDVEKDWLAHFFDKCRHISDDEMQSLWSSILAGEANRPKSFSTRTVDLAATLDKSDAQLFSRFCRYVWFVGEPIALIYNPRDDAFIKAGMNFLAVSHLNDIGLINFDTSKNFVLQELPKTITMFYHKRPINIDFPTYGHTFITGPAMLTRAGKELARICETQPDQEYLEHILGYWIGQGYAVYTPLIPKMDETLPTEPVPMMRKTVHRS